MAAFPFAFDTRLDPYFWDLNSPNTAVPYAARKAIRQQEMGRRAPGVRRLGPVEARDRTRRLTDIDDLRGRLRENAAEIARDLLGEPNRAQSDRSTLRFGNRGSISVITTGRKAGLWFDHEARDGGDLLKLIQRERGPDFASALAWARHWFGMPADPLQVLQASPQAAAMAEARRVEREAQKASQEQAEARDEARRIREARRRWDRARSIDGTHAEAYLIETRRIPKPQSGWPSDILRYDGSAVALVLAVRDDAGEVVAVQCISLRRTPDGHVSKRPDAGGVAKRTYGLLGGRPVMLPGDPDGQLLIGEGPETGLTAWSASGFETWVMLGSIAKATPPAGRAVIVLRENDKQDAPSRRRADEAVAEWRLAGLDVREVWPPAGLKDLNDLLQAEGVEAVRDAILAAVEGDAGAVGPVVYPVLPTTIPLVEADDAVRLAVKGFFTSEDRQRQQIIIGELGLGKTEAVLDEGLDFCREEHGLPNRRICFVTQDHNLAENVAARANAIQPESAQIWLGMDRPDPDDPDMKMCLRLEDVDAAVKAGGSAKHVCGSKDAGYCPFHPKSGTGQRSCAYRMQKDERRPIIILAGPSTLTQAPPEQLDGFTVTVVDETRPSNFQGGVGRTPERVRLSGLSVPLTLPKIPARTVLRQELEEANARRDILRRLLDEQAAKGNTHLPLGDLRKTGFTAESLMALYRSLKDLMEAVPSIATASAGQVAELLKRPLEANARFFKLRKLARALAQGLADNVDQPDDVLVGQIRIESYRDEPCFVVGWREEIHDAYASKPILLLDGTGNPALLRRWFPRLEVAAEIRVPWSEHVRVRQIYDKAVTYASWTPGGDPYDNDATEQDVTAERNLERLKLYAQSRARKAKEASMILPQATEDWLDGRWKKKRPLRLGHFNKIRGDDSFKTTDDLTTWSRPQAGPAAFEWMEAIHNGRWGETLPKGAKYPKRPAVFHLRDGSTWPTVTDYHPSPTAEAYRWQTCEAELLQSAARLRPLRRGSENPAILTIGTRVPLPIIVDELLTQEEVLAEANQLDDLIGRGIVPTNGRGRWAFLAAVLGGTDESWRAYCSRHPDIAERFEAACLKRSIPYNESSIGVRPLEPASCWAVRPHAKNRCSAVVYLDGVQPDDVEAARTKLGFDPYELKPVTPKRKRAPKAKPAQTAALAAAQLPDQASAGILAPSTERPEREPPQEPAQDLTFPSSWHGGHLGELFMPALPADDDDVVEEALLWGGLAHHPFFPPAPIVVRRASYACGPAPWWPPEDVEVEVLPARLVAGTEAAGWGLTAMP